MIDERDRRSLLRLLCGEAGADERRRIESRLTDEPELEAAARRLERLWRALEPPPGDAARGFADELMARIRGVEPAAPPWARLAAAAALAAGIALGAGLARLEPLQESAAAEPTLAERYLEAVTRLGEEVAE